MQRACDQCGVAYEARRSTSKFCSATCRQRHHVKPIASPIVSITASTPINGGLYEATERQLAEAGRLDTYLGQQALALALRIVAPANDTGSSTAALSKELRAVMAEALEGAAAAADPLDELKAWRDRRRANAG